MAAHEDADLGGIAMAIGQALREFGRLSLDGGLLAQVWMPGADKISSAEQGIRLQTKGLPYSILGPGDMLAIFRCLSCKYEFNADLDKQEEMGAPGRVFVSGEAETSDNVQGCNTSIYLRAKDAKACRVSSTLLLPIYASPDRVTAVAVLEVTQFRDRSGVTYQTVFEWAKLALEAVRLFTPAEIQTRTFEMQSHALSIRFFSSRNSALGCFFGMDANADGVLQSLDMPADLLTPGNLQEVDSPRKVLGHLPRGKPLSVPNQMQEGDGRGDNSGSLTPSPRKHSRTSTESQRKATSQVPASKALLTKEDLEKHFGLGLKEAAARLGVCNTTLKRACRRHGIMKWPRRDLLKAAQQQGSSIDMTGSVSSSPKQPSQPRKPATKQALSSLGLQEPGQSQPAPLMQQHSLPQFSMSVQHQTPGQARLQEAGQFGIASTGDWLAPPAHRTLLQSRSGASGPALSVTNSETSGPISGAVRQGIPHHTDDNIGHSVRGANKFSALTAVNRSLSGSADAFLAQDRQENRGEVFASMGMSELQDATDSINDSHHLGKEMLHQPLQPYSISQLGRSPFGAAGERQETLPASNSGGIVPVTDTSLHGQESGTPVPSAADALDHTTTNRFGSLGLVDALLGQDAPDLHDLEFLGNEAYDWEPALEARDEDMR